MYCCFKPLYPLFSPYVHECGCKKKFEKYFLSSGALSFGGIIKHGLNNIVLAFGGLLRSVELFRSKKPVFRAKKFCTNRFFCHFSIFKLIWLSQYSELSLLLQGKYAPWAGHKSARKKSGVNRVKKKKIRKNTKSRAIWPVTFEHFRGQIANPKCSTRW